MSFATTDTRVCAACGGPLYLDGGDVIWISGLEYHTFCAARLQTYGTGRLIQTDRDALRDERDNLRAALIAAMEIVQRERVRIAYNAKGAPPAIEIGYADIMRRLDAVIAQADAALGSER